MVAKTQRSVAATDGIASYWTRPINVRSALRQVAQSPPNCELLIVSTKSSGLVNVILYVAATKTYVSTTWWLPITKRITSCKYAVLRRTRAWCGGCLQWRTSNKVHLSVSIEEKSWPRSKETCEAVITMKMDWATYLIWMIHLRMSRESKTFSWVIGESSSHFVLIQCSTATSLGSLIMPVTQMFNHSTCQGQLRARPSTR